MAAPADDAPTDDTVADTDDTTVAPPGPELLHGAPLSGSGTQRTLHPDRDAYPELMAALRADGYWVCTDLCGVDYLGFAARRGLPEGVEAERFEVVANLLDPTQRVRLRVRVQVPESDPTIASLTSVHPGVDYHERETWDLFGIHFEGHPHLTRILMPDDWDGHPLRKDYAMGTIPVQFKAAGTAR
jgi:NADH-quinone oxidoreductase subunit C